MKAAAQRVRTRPATTMEIQIPQGTAPGATLQVRAPDGRTVKVRVPPNLRAGQRMRISVPAALEKAAEEIRGRCRPRPLPPATVKALAGKMIGLRQPDLDGYLTVKDNGKLGTKRGAWAGWDICKFEIRDAGNDEIALRHPGTGRWLRMTAQGCVFSMGPKIPGSAFKLHDAGDGPLSLTGAAPEWPSGRRISLRGASSRLVQAQQLARGTRVCVINDGQAVREAFRAKDVWPLSMPDGWQASLGGEFIVERHDQNDSTLLLVKPGVTFNQDQANGQWWPYSVLCLDKPRRWLEVGGKRAFEIADLQKMANVAAERAEAKRRAQGEAAAEAKRRAGEAEARAADEKRRTDAEAELRAAAAEEARARAAGGEKRHAGRIDCESPRIELSGNSELSSKIDALFKLRRSPALAGQLNKIFKNHDAIPRYYA